MPWLERQQTQGTETRRRRLGQIVWAPAIAAIWLAAGFSGFVVDIGFGLKPFMIVSVFVSLLLLKVRSVPRLRLFELLYLAFASTFALTTIYAADVHAAIRLDAGLLLVTALYFTWRSLAARATATQLHRMLDIVAKLLTVFALAYYAIGMLLIRGHFSALNGRAVFGVLVDRTLPRLIGGLGDPNIFAFTFTWVAFFFLSRFRRRWGFALAALAALALTLSKGGLAGLAVGFVAFVATSWRRDRTSRRLGLLIPLLAALALGLAAVSVGNFQEVAQRRLNASNFWSGRKVLWMDALDVYGKHPLTGVGIFNFRTYEQADFSSNKYIHNTYLEVLVEGGLITFLLYVAFQGALLLEAFRLRSKESWVFPTVLAMQVQMFGLSLLIHEPLFIVMASMFAFGTQHPDAVRDPHAQSGPGH